MTVLGTATTGTLAADDIETWLIEVGTTITVTGAELQAVCPVTGNPDIYRFTITHEGNRECESKALKMYLLSFRDLGISCATLATRIANDLGGVLGTPVTVALTQQTRGGMELGATVTRG